MTYPRNYRKSTRSGGSGGNYVEWAHTAHTVYIRNSKDPVGPELAATYSEWEELIRAVGKGHEHPWVIHLPSGVQICKDGQELRFTSAEWTAFRAEINDGECVPVGG